MPTARQIATLVTRHGFTPISDPGFVSYRRTHPDGRAQLLRVFWWSNPAVAEKRGIPSAYLVACLGLDQDTREQARFRLPLVDWPSSAQQRRPWRDVAAEFTSVFLDALNASSADGRRKLDRLGSRYQL